jgi:hypothetical protein
MGIRGRHKKAKSIAKQSHVMAVFRLGLVSGVMFQQQLRRQASYGSPVDDALSGQALRGVDGIATIGPGADLPAVASFVKDQRVKVDMSPVPRRQD